MKNPKTIILVFIYFLGGNIFSQPVDSIYVNNQFTRIKRLINSKNDSVTLALEQLNDYSKKNNNKFGKLKYIFLSGFVKMKAGEFDKAISIFQEYIELSKDSLNKETIDQVNRIALCYNSLGNIEKCAYYYERANLLSKKAGYDKGLADSYNGVGMLDELQGKYENAIQMYLKSNEIYEKNKDSLGISAILSNIGNIMYYQNKLSKALDYYRRGAIIDARMKNTKHLATSYGNIGMIYNVDKKMDSALFYNLKCMDLLEKINDVHDLGSIYNNVALVYFDLNKLEEALKYNLKSIEIKEKIGDKNGLATSIINVGNLKFKQKKYKESEEYYLKGLELSKEINSPLFKMNAHKGLSEAYKELGLYEKSLLQHIYYSDTKDSLNEIDAKNRISELETKFETKQNQNLIGLQKKQLESEVVINKQIQANSKQKSILLLISIAGIIALSVLSIFAFTNYRKKQKANELLSEQKKIIELKNSENELLLGEIHHRVKNNLQVISSLLSLQEKNIEDAGVKSAIQEGKERVRSMELVHKMLYQENSFTGIEMKDYVNKLSRGLLESFGLNSEDVELLSEFKALVLDVDTAIPVGLILNELIVNSLKHAKEKTKKLILKIELHEENSKLYINIADNGNGKISNIESSNSFGLKIIHALIRQLDGVMEVSEDGGLQHSIVLKNYKLIV